MSVHTDHLDDNEDIYRGDPPGPDPSIRLSSSASSSSSSSLAAGRLGAIATKLELAISRWAKNVRGNSSDASDSSSTSSSSSSSSSSRSSVVTLTKSQLARRRRRRSMSSLRSMQSEREIAARITRLKALEKSRQIPREFGLYLPPSVAPPALQLSSQTDHERGHAQDQRITWTTSLPLVLAQLDLAIRRSARRRRLRGKQRESTDDNAVMETSAAFLPALTPLRYRGSSAPPSKSASSIAGRKVKKGKHRATPEPAPTLTYKVEDSQAKPEAWFLDIANPTWTDLKAIGKLLHIHPLTLEDILQQDPREKLELFNRLGYYFISFRAIESQKTREKFRRETLVSDSSGNKSAVDDGFIGAANVYLTIFKDGICCFHFTDISEHTNRVRDRLVLLEQVMNKSSDWITHNILDSIVDSFFPFLEEIEKEVMAIDHIVYAGSSAFVPTELDIELSNPVAKAPPKTDGIEKRTDVCPLDEKHASASKLRESFRPRFASPRLTIRLLLRRAKRHISHSWSRIWAKSESSPSSIQLNLRRMARARKLVTILSRLLATKSEVISRIRKRLSVNASGKQTGEDFELSIYMGDVQDHILTLQHSLTYYEHVLSQSHPTYLAQIRSMSETAKQGADKKLLYLTCVTLSVLCILTLTGLFSMNITIPRNQRAAGHPFNWFYVILALSALIVFSLLCLVRHWYKTVKRRHGRPL